MLTHHPRAVSTESLVFSRRKAGRPRVGEMNPQKTLLAVDAGCEVVELAAHRYATGVGPRQPQLNGGSNVRCTFDVQQSAGLSCYSMDHGKTQTGCHAGAFGGEKRFGRL